MSETLEVGGLSFEVRRSARRKTLGLTVDRGGELVDPCPERPADDELTRWIQIEAALGASQARAQGGTGAEGSRAGVRNRREFQLPGPHLSPDDDGIRRSRCDSMAGVSFCAGSRIRRAAHFRRWYI